MRAITSLASLLAGLALLLTACTDPSVPTLQLGLVEPPIPELAPAYQDFTINTQEEAVLTLPSGTVITIPPNTLVDAAGQAITGEAMVHYREYHDAASVVLSGIPMNYNSNGQNRHFQTAGMFDIAAEQAGKALAVRADGGIQVDLASYEEDTDYNLFALNQEKGWQFVDYVAPVANPQREVLDQEIKTLTKKMGSMVSPYFIFNYDGILDVSFNNNPLSAKHRADSKVRRKFQAYSIESYKGASFNYITYQSTNYPSGLMIWKNLGRRFPSWVRNKPCSFRLKALKGNTYQVTTEYEGKKFEGKVMAIMPLKYLFDYTPERWKNDLAKVLKDMSSKEEKYRAELEKLRLHQAQQAAVLRSFKIAGFGIYNYDRLQKEEQKIDILANFEVQNEDPLDWVLCLPEDGKTVIKYNREQWKKVVLLPNNKAKFISILPNKKVALYSAKAYQALNFEALAKQEERPEITFELLMVLEQLESEEDLRTLLAS